MSTVPAAADPAADDPPAPRWWWKPPGAAFHLVVCIPLDLLLLAYSVPHGDWLALLLAVPLLVLATLAWLIRWSMWGVARVRRRGGGRWPRRLFVAPAVLAGMLAVCLSTDLPLQIRFQGSRRAFDQALHQPDRREGNGGPCVVRPRWRGTFRVAQVGRHELWECGTALGGVDPGHPPNGFIHLPDGPGPNLVLEDAGRVGKTSQLVPLGGGWYGIGARPVDWPTFRLW